LQEATTPTLQMGAGEVAPQAQSMDGERPDVPEVDHQALPASSLAAGGVGYPEADQEAPATSPEAGEHLWTNAWKAVCFTILSSCHLVWTSMPHPAGFFL
jgi:hypothetical protein